MTQFIMTEKEFIDKYIPLRDKGLSLENIGSQIGMSRATVQRLAKRYGVYESSLSKRKNLIRNKSGKEVIGNWEVDFDTTKRNENGEKIFCATNVTGKRGVKKGEIRWLTQVGIRQMERNRKRRERRKKSDRNKLAPNKTGFERNKGICAATITYLGRKMIISMHNTPELARAAEKIALETLLSPDHPREL